MPPKSHRTAVAALPPEEVWGPIQAVRRAHDRQFRRWMPHINLLYPFLPPDGLAAAAPRLAAICAGVPPFIVTLARIRHFAHASGGKTLWLEPEPAGPLRELQAALQAGFPEYDDLSRFRGGFTPHLSIGQAPSTAALHRLLEELQPTWQPLRFEITSVALIRRDAHSPFRVEQRFPLGGLL